MIHELDDDGEAENVIAINPEAEKELEIRMSVRGYEICPNFHKRVNTDPHLRALVCRDCGKVIDPFEYILKWAQDGERRMTGLEGLEAKTKIADNELKNLERKIDNARATLKRLGQPQPDVERMAFKNALYNA